MEKVINLKGEEINFNAAVNLMDDESREEVNAEFAPCDPQEFFNAYSTKHRERFNEDFAPFVGGEW